MIGYFRHRFLTGAVVLLSLLLGGVVSAQEGGAPPPAQEGGAEDKPAPKKPATPTRKVLDHRKQFVIYPRLGLVRVMGGGEGAIPIDQRAAGLDFQLGLKRKFILSAEVHLMNISSGEYGLTFSPRDNTLARYGTGDFTFMVGGGIGMFTGLLDKQQFWTHLSLKAGYMNPFFLPIWLGGDLEKEFKRTRGSYWVFSLAPMVGVLIPLREPVVAENYVPVAPEDVIPGLEPPTTIRILLGLQGSVAFIFAPRG